LYRTILNKLYCNGLSEYITEEEIRKFIWERTKPPESSSEHSGNESKKTDTS
jgi:hypothetical protein